MRLTTLSLVQLLHTSQSCFISALLLALFAQPQMLGSSVFLGWGRDLFITSTCDRELFLFCQAFVFALFFYLKTEEKKPPISSLLHTDLSFSFFTLYQPVTSNACICRRCVCVCVRVCGDDDDDKMSVSVYLCKRSGLLQDGVP